jgi:hypothetical protein
MALQDFESDYHDAVEDVRRASHRLFADRLQQWWHVLDAFPQASVLLSTLTNDFDFDAWYQRGLQTVSSMVGSGRLDWSTDRRERLAQNAGLFRFLAANPQGYADFASNFLWAGSRLDDAVAKITDELFQPFARDLLKEIKRAPVQPSPVPAADRIVALDHNSSAYVDTVKALSEIECAVTASNSLAVEYPATHNRVIAEISAGRRLLEGAQVRAELAWQVLHPPLTWIAEHVAETALSIAVTAAIALIASLLGIPIPGLSP